MRKIGIWIDRRRAVVVTIEEGRESREVIEGDIERHARPSGGWRSKTPYGPQVDNKERQREERYRLHVTNFYKDVIKHIGKADQLLVMGPADAKNEFAELAKKTPELRDVPTVLEPADRMTEPQIAARVRAFEVA